MVLLCSGPRICFGGLWIGIVLGLDGGLRDVLGGGDEGMISREVEDCIDEMRNVSEFLRGRENFC